MQALYVKSRKKGSRKRTCPKVDMPKSRQVPCALLNAYACGCDSRTHVLGPWPPWPQNRPIRMVAVTDCAPSIDPRNRLTASATWPIPESQPETYDGMPSRTLLKILPPIVVETECNLPVSMLQAVAVDSSKHRADQTAPHFCAIRGEAIVKEP
jgi:hypothetical protein